MDLFVALDASRIAFKVRVIALADAPCRRRANRGRRASQKESVRDWGRGRCKTPRQVGYGRGNPSISSTLRLQKHAAQKSTHSIVLMINSCIATSKRNWVHFGSSCSISCPRPVRLSGSALRHKGEEDAGPQVQGRQARALHPRRIRRRDPEGAVVEGVLQRLSVSSTG